ncbi:MAG TPA: protease modulator HflK [Kofleriaceae bacterium]|nr:protease modulator HflK [Kofleriaceae bacterium]
MSRLARPLARLLDAAWRRMHWWIALMAILYLASGITIVKPGEVAIVLRWGRLVPGTHGPGLVFALPRPIDEVVRVDVKHVSELRVTALTDLTGGVSASLDPLRTGYAVSGDHNIVHVDMVARYQVRDPAEWALHGARSVDVLRVEVTAAMVRSLGEMGVDRVLADGRKELIETTTRRTQAGLDAAHTGLALVSLELTRLSPPLAVARDFDAVQSAVIGATTAQKRAQEIAQRELPQAQADADQAIQEAHGEAADALARANGDAAAFLDLDREYRQNPAVVRERLYRDAVERAISAGRVRWVPPPVGKRYEGLRITVEPGAGAAAAGQGNGGAGGDGQDEGEGD